MTLVSITPDLLLAALAPEFAPQRKREPSIPATLRFVARLPRFVSAVYIGGGTTALAADAEGAAAMLLAGGTAEVGELVKVVAEQVAASRDDDSTGRGR